MVYLYTDGACSGNPGPGGYGVILEWNGHRKELSQGFRLTTNNRMELLAVIVGLEALTKPNLPVTIVSDSKYVIEAVQNRWVWNWVRTGFKNKKNSDLWMRFLRVYENHKVQFKWVKGHAGHKENERCDVLAVLASQSKDLLADSWFEKEINGAQGIFTP